MCRRACWASYIEARWCADGTTFAHRKLLEWGFARELWGWIFLFFVGGGGCAKVVPKAHRGWREKTPGAGLRGLIRETASDSFAPAARGWGGCAGAEFGVS